MDKDISSAIDWIVGIIIAVIAIFALASANTKNSTETSTLPTTNNTTVVKAVTTKTTDTKTTTTPATTPKPATVTWHCVDATSYNKNPYDDNRCTSSTGEVRYVSDSQSRQLDPTYSPGTSGHWWYNSK